MSTSSENRRTAAYAFASDVPPLNTSSGPKDALNNASSTSTTQMSFSSK